MSTGCNEAVQSYAQHADQDRLRQRIAELNRLQKMDGEIANILNKEGVPHSTWAAVLRQYGSLFAEAMADPDSQDQRNAANPPRWPDGSYSVQGAAAAIGITPQVIFDWLRKGWLTGKQLAKGMPWQIDLSPEQAMELRARVRRTSRSKMEAS